MILFSIGALLLFVYFVLAFIKPFEAILFAFSIKPVMDMSYHIEVAGLTLGRLMSVIIVFHFLACIFLSIKHWSTIRVRYFVVVWIVMTFISYAVTGLENIIMGLELLFRYMNFLLPFLAVPFVINRNENLFFKVLILASFFPITVSLLQIAGIPIGFHEKTIAGLLRPRGFFHDIFTNRLYFLYGMVGSSYFLVRGKKLSTKWLGGIFFILANICMLYMYSKSGYLIIAFFWLLIFIHLRIPHKKVIVPLTIPLIILLLIFYADQFMAVYQKEINFLLGQEKVGRLFQGRVFGWIDAIKEWSNSGLAQQFFGQGDLALGMHNDFLRILFSNGLLGLFLYLVFLLYIFVLLCLNYFKKRTFEVALAITLFFVFILDSIGLVPTLYPAYNWMVWGIISYFISDMYKEDYQAKLDMPDDLSLAG